MTTRSLRLGEVAMINPRDRADQPNTRLVSFVPMSAFSETTGSVVGEQFRPIGEVKVGYTQFRNGDVLLAKITPCFENGKIGQAALTHDLGFGSTEFHVVRPMPGKSDARFLHHFLRTPQVRKAGTKQMTGSAGQRRVPATFLETLKVHLPPLDEQRRIAAILDKAEELRAKRRAAIALLDQLPQAIFLEMFGEPASNPKGWPTKSLAEVLAMPLRNGLSPSNSGSVMAKVLTLSAITGSGFNADAWKVATFSFPPPASQSVDRLDFLICRGNGNLQLVGRGHFPTTSMRDTTFPDTMIAARVCTRSIEPPFLEQVWNSNAVRSQIESLARTTNGTHKVNQTMLEGIRMIAPPIDLQRAYAACVETIDRANAAHQFALAECEALFASFQNRVFTNESEGLKDAVLAGGSNGRAS